MRELILLCIIGVATAALMRQRLPTIPPEFEDKKGCYVKSLNTVIPFDEFVTPIGNCMRVECTSDEIVYVSCALIGTSDNNCNVTEVDNTLPYPDCCQTVKCNDINSY